MTDDFATRTASIGTLADPARRALYQYVVAQVDPVGRDQAAAETGLPRHAAKFHLDRLVAEGLLEVEFRRLSGRRGPGAGRPAKLYRRAAREVSVSLPERNYALAGQILAEAIEEAVGDDGPILAAVARAAAAAGRRIGAQSRAAAASSLTAAASGSTTPVSMAEVLASCGYEPRAQGDRVILMNCPFHALATLHTELVCGMNLDIVTAMALELEHTEAEARLDPAPNRCCVTLRNSA